MCADDGLILARIDVIHVRFLKAFGPVLNNSEGSLNERKLPPTLTLYFSSLNSFSWIMTKY